MAISKQQLKETITTEIRNKTAAGSITKTIIADRIDAALDYTDQELLALSALKPDLDSATGKIKESQLPLRDPVALLESSIRAIPGYNAAIPQVVVTVVNPEGSTASMLSLVPLSSLGSSSSGSTSGGTSSQMTLAVTAQYGGPFELVSPNSSFNFELTVTGGQAPYTATITSLDKPNANSQGGSGFDPQPSANVFRPYLYLVEPGNTNNNGNYTLHFQVIDNNGLIATAQKTVVSTGH